MCATCTAHFTLLLLVTLVILGEEQIMKHIMQFLSNFLLSVKHVTNCNTKQISHRMIMHKRHSKGQER